MFLFISAGSPSGAFKRTSSGRNVVKPLDDFRDDTAMELSASGKKQKGLNEYCMLKMLSRGKGSSIFEIAKQGLQETGTVDKEIISAKDNEGFSLLHHAARCDQAELVSFLLDNGADIDMKGDNGFTALHVAVRYVNITWFSHFYNLRSGVLSFGERIFIYNHFSIILFHREEGRGEGGIKNSCFVRTANFPWVLKRTWK